METDNHDELKGRLEVKLRRARKRIVDGWVPRRDFLTPKKRNEAATWIRKQKIRVAAALFDQDEILFERALAGLEKGFEKLNRLCGEAYRKRYPEPEERPLRYFRWMSIRYMKLACELGEFYIVPRIPERKPKVAHWLTADEMIDILNNPAAIASIKTFGLPSRPELIEKPKRGEKHLHLDYTDSEHPQIYFDFPEGVKRV